MQNFLFVDLAGLTPGKPFAGFAAGDFVDMNGRAVSFKPGALKVFLANTLKAIEKAKAKGMPGLPVDARQHDKGEAAGWIVDASEGEVEDSDGAAVPVIMLAAEWTKLGIELLRDRIMANFSPTVDLREKVIRGGSLTNWPASVDASGAPLFPAVELALGLYRLQQPESLEARAAAVRTAWRRWFANDDEVPAGQVWVIEVFEEYLIAGTESRQFRVAYEVDGAITFAPREEWVEVEQAWVEAAIGRKLSETELGKRPGMAAPSGKAAEDAAGQDVERSRDDEVVDMNMTKEELGALVAEQVRAALAAELQAAARPAGNEAGGAAAGAVPEFDVLSFLEMSAASDDVVGAFKQQMLEQYDLMKKRAASEAAEMIGRIRREADIAEFAQLVTGGSSEVPFGLPVGVDDLKEFLGRLQPTDLEFAKKLLGDIQTQGRQKFAELGHGKQGRGGLELPAVYARQLDRGELTLGDLGAPELGLGEVGQYDLSRWANGGK